MICRPLPSNVSDWIKPRERLARSAGWHVSTVIVAMLKAMGVNRYDTWGKRTEPRKPTDEVGYMWEDVLSEPLADRVLSEGMIRMPATELHLDGTYGTPDRPFFDVPRSRFVVEEVKATYMSCGTVVNEQLEPTENFVNERKFSYWRLQSMTYAAMIHQAPPQAWYWHLKDQIGEGAAWHWREAQANPPLIRIRALFLNGRYKGELAVPAGWELEPSEAELSAWWANVVRFAREHPDLKTPGEEPV